MPFFDAIYAAAKNRDEKALSLILMQPEAHIDEIQQLALTPAGKFAREGDVEAAKWLMEKFGAGKAGVYYGAVLGKHIDQFASAEIITDLSMACLDSDASNEVTSKHGALLMAYAELGDLAAVKNLKPLQMTSRKAVVKGAAYGAQEAILKEYLSNYDFKMEEETIKWLAFAGHKELLFARLSGACYAEVFKGAAKNPQHQFLDELLAHPSMAYHDEGLFNALDEASANGDIELTNKIIGKEGLHQGKALYNAALNCRFALLTSLLGRFHDEIAYERVAAGIIARFPRLTSFDFVEYLGNFNVQHSQGIIAALTNSLKNNVELSGILLPRVVESAPIVAKVIELKENYLLLPCQAHALYECRDLLSSMMDKDCDVSLLSKLICSKLGDKKFNGRQLNEYMVEDLITRVRTNAPRAQLIEDVGKYCNAQSSLWSSLWSNHGRRAASFLTAVKEAKSLDESNQLVTSQHTLFQSTDGDKSVDSKTVKHNKPVKHVDVKDGFYEAVEACYARISHTR